MRRHQASGDAALKQLLAAMRKAGTSGDSAKRRNQAQSLLVKLAKAHPARETAIAALGEAFQWLAATGAPTRELDRAPAGTADLLRKLAQTPWPGTAGVVLERAANALRDDAADEHGMLLRALPASLMSDPALRQVAKRKPRLKSILQLAATDVAGWGDSSAAGWLAGHAPPAIASELLAHVLGEGARPAEAAPREQVLAALLDRPDGAVMCARAWANAQRKPALGHLIWSVVLEDLPRTAREAERQLAQAMEAATWPAAKHELGQLLAAVLSPENFKHALRGSLLLGQLRLAVDQRLAHRQPAPTGLRQFLAEGLGQLARAGAGRAGEALRVLTDDEISQLLSSHQGELTPELARRIARNIDLIRTSDQDPVSVLEAMAGNLGLLVEHASEPCTFDPLVHEGEEGLMPGEACIELRAGWRLASGQLIRRPLVGVIPKK